MKSNKALNPHNNNKQERVKVFVRIRPFNEDEIKLGGESTFKTIDTKNNVVSVKTDYSTKPYAYDGIYDENSSQEEVFQNSATKVLDVRIII